MRLSDCRHLHCTGTAIRVSRMSCAQGSPGSEPAGPVRTGPAARPACAPALQVFRCVGTWMCAHTPGKRVSLVHTAAAPPFRLPCPPPRAPSQFRTVGKKFAPNCPTPQTLALFSVPHRLSGLWGAHEQYLSNPWAPRHADLCMWKPERRSFTHSRSHARSLDRAFFRSQSETSRPYMCGGGRTDTTNRLSENHL